MFSSILWIVKQQKALMHLRRCLYKCKCHWKLTPNVMVFFWLVIRLLDWDISDNSCKHKHLFLSPPALVWENLTLRCFDAFIFKEFTESFSFISYFVFESLKSVIHPNLNEYVHKKKVRQIMWSLTMQRHEHCFQISVYNIIVYYIGWRGSIKILVD